MRPEEAKDADVVVVVWSTATDYPRLRDLFGDYPETFAEFVLDSTERLRALGIDASRVRRIPVDPDDMHAWCIRHHGDAEPDKRALYVLGKFRASHHAGRDATN